jgi:hypothetical protein
MKAILIAAAEPALDHTWHYAGWVSVDVRLLLFLVMLSVVGSLGITAIVARDRSRAEIGATWLLFGVTLLAILILMFNHIAAYPVFAVEAFFPFP